MFTIYLSHKLNKTKKFRTVLLLSAIILLVNNTWAEIKESEKYFQKSKNYYLIEDFDLALDQIKQAIDFDPNKAKYYSLLGMIYGQLNQTDKKFAANQNVNNLYKKAIERNPKDLNAYMDLIYFYGMLGDNKQMVHWLEQVLSINTEYYPAQSMLIKTYMTMASEETNRGHKEKAHYYYKKSSEYIEKTIRTLEKHKDKNYQSHIDQYKTTLKRIKREDEELFTNYPDKNSLDLKSFINAREVVGEIDL